MEHHNPHQGVKFEGYFTRFDLPSGATLAVVVCTVPEADNPKKHVCSLRYVPSGTPDSTADNNPIIAGLGQEHIYSIDLWLQTLDFRAEQGGFMLHGSGDAFDDAGSETSSYNSIRKVHGPEVYIWATQGNITYSINDTARGIHLKATSQNRTPWSFLPHAPSSTPESWLVNLPLPLHWHVHSLASEVAFALALPAEANLSAVDTEGTAIAHEEKNWANGFPKAHVWALGRTFGYATERPVSLAERPLSMEESPDRISGKELDRSVCLAGGKILGTEAFLIGYRNRSLDLSLDFKPPLAMRLFGMSPFLGFVHDYKTRSFHLSVEGLRYRLDISASAPKSSFYAFAAPQPDGFKENAMHESLRGSIKVTVWKRRWLKFKWEQVTEDHFDNAGVEFGGDYYPDRGIKMHTS